MSAQQRIRTKYFESEEFYSRLRINNQSVQEKRTVNDRSASGSKVKWS